MFCISTIIKPKPGDSQVSSLRFLRLRRFKRTTGDCMLTFCLTAAFLPAYLRSTEEFSYRQTNMFTFGVSHQCIALCVSLRCFLPFQSSSPNILELHCLHTHQVRFFLLHCPPLACHYTSLHISTNTLSVSEMVWKTFSRTVCNVSSTCVPLCTYIQTEWRASNNKNTNKQCYYSTNTQISRPAGCYGGLQLPNINKGLNNEADMDSEM